MRRTLKNVKCLFVEIARDRFAAAGARTFEHLVDEVTVVVDAMLVTQRRVAVTDAVLRHQHRHVVVLVTQPAQHRPEELRRHSQPIRTRAATQTNSESP